MHINDSNLITPDPKNAKHFGAKNGSNGFIAIEDSMSARERRNTETHVKFDERNIVHE